MWVPGTEFQSSVRAASTLNYGAISPDPCGSSVYNSLRKRHTAFHNGCANFHVSSRHKDSLSSRLTNTHHFSFIITVPGAGAMAKSTGCFSRRMGSVPSTHVDLTPFSGLR